MIRRVLSDRQTAYEKAKLLRETKTVKELLGEPTSYHEAPIEESKPSPNASATDGSASLQESNVQPQRSAPRERRTVLGPRPES